MERHVLQESVTLTQIFFSFDVLLFAWDCLCLYGDTLNYDVTLTGVYDLEMIYVSYVFLSQTQTLIENGDSVLSDDDVWENEIMILILMKTVI
jgi:hypothetical protein